jgi:putative phage-type endonuclease
MKSLNKLTTDEAKQVLEIYKLLNNKKKKLEIPEKYQKIIDLVNELLKRPQSEQRTEAWFKEREEMITASDIAASIGDNKYEPKYRFILKKCKMGPPFTENDFVHHGKKFERVGTMIYELRNNVKVLDFGLLRHHKYSFLGASPDGICSHLTLKKEFSRFIGRMLEIKFPKTRKIQETDDPEIAVPDSYKPQVQIQLESCKLEECDFLQCKAVEYNNLQAYREDVGDKEWISKDTGLERGIFIQLMPKNRKDFDHEYEGKYIYPDKIDMTEKEYESWIGKVMLSLKEKHPDYVFDRFVYWKVLIVQCNLVKRNRKWFEKKLPIMKKTWDYVLFFRKNQDKLKLWYKYAHVLGKNDDEKIMKIADKLIGDKNYYKVLKKQLDDYDDPPPPDKIEYKYHKPEVEDDPEDDLPVHKGSMFLDDSDDD